MSAPDTQASLAPHPLGDYIRPHVLSLPAYVPGKSAPNAAKLSSNENPSAPPASVLQAISAAAKNTNRYPDLLCTRLREALVEHFAGDLPGINVDNIVVSTGSSALLVAALSAVALPGREVIYPWRSFESYPIAVPTVGSVPRPVSLTLDGRVDLDAMRAAINERTSSVILCTPNNPTGPALTFAQVKAFIEQVPPHVLVLVDEAYIELATSAGVSTAVPLIADHPNVVVLRTFSKVYALAGLRVGYAVADPYVIAAIQKICIPFGVSTVAQAAAVAALADQDFVRDSREQAIAERTRMITALRGMGYQVPDSDANFYFIPAAQAGTEFVQACLDAGVIVRPFPEGIRITVGTPADNDQVLDVARHCINSSKH